ncbi:MAG: alanine racemase, partial [Oceanisphaera sp.]|nr:alanine racemase [Oceanisphaera sp.]
HSEYFQTLSRMLHREKLARPTMLVDLDRVDHNIAELKKHLGDKAYRIVAKSIPVPGLIDYVMKQSQSDRLMVFHQPFLNLIAREMPDAQLLVGKPMPAEAARRFYQYHQQPAFTPATQLEWLIDSPLRLRQYRELANALGQPMKLNLELDVGLHRGGYTDPAVLAQSIRDIQQDPLLQFSGLMGYEAHASKMPSIVGGPEQALQDAMAFYGRCVDAVRETLGEQFDPAQLTLNAGGSSTFQMYDQSAPCNELAMGSGLVKPTDFDVQYLSNHLPAAFIATPVLKALDRTQLPGLEGLTGLFRALDPNTAHTFFTYGGYWKAIPESPPGLSYNALLGSSTNQEMLNGSRAVSL